MGRKLVEELVRRNPVYRGKQVTFCVDDVRLPNGKPATREYMEHPGAVGVLPFLDRSTIVLVRQYRFPVREVTLEMPAGKLEKGEPVLPCVRRELREETGYTSRKISPLLDYWPTPAFATEVLHLFVAEKLVPGRLSPDEDEFLEVVPMPFSRALSLARSGKIRDSKTLIGLLACAAWRK
jgi:ADP-ribose pyrophosphatase